MGSKAWLIGTELKYGGLVKKVPRKKVSPLDERTPQQLATGGMQGGDRMLFHGYAKTYESVLRRYIGKSVTLVEVGILKGTGLAIWSELFENSKIIGLDIDLSYTQKNIPQLKKNGAFNEGNPELHEFDQLQNNTNLMKKILSARKIDIFIDDGLHTDESIIRTFESVEPYLSEDFTYIIEANHTAYATLEAQYGQYEFTNEKLITVVKRKLL